MSNARNLARLIVDSGGDVDVSSLGNVPPSNDASALTTGTLPVGRLPSSGVDAGSLTTGTLPTSQLPVGTVLQVVSVRGVGGDTLYSQGVNVTTVSASITPTSSSSKILIIADGYAYGNGGSNTWIGGNITRNGVYLAQSDTGFFGVSQPYAGAPVGASCIDTAGTTSSITYGLLLTTGSGGTTSFYVSPTRNHITLLEISA